jgi:site-specific DNA-methyltransferase (adenine-specific)
MNKKWDYDVPSQEIWEECLRVLKPGGHLLSFGGSRTYHRMAVRIEDAGFDIRDQIMWIYGSGFPKSHNIGDGIGTALKPAHEPIVLARKPLSEKTIKENVLKWGTGGMNIDVSRIEYKDDKPIGRDCLRDKTTMTGWASGGLGDRTEDWEPNNTGRWPANIILDEGEEPWRKYFYCPKTSKKDRDEGLDEFEEKAQRQSSGGSRDFNARCANCGKKFIGSPETICSCDNPITDNTVFKKKNNHPTVKPTELMEYLIKLVTPKGGTVLDPFMGSGSTGKAAIRGGFDFVGIEKEEEYIKIAEARINNEIK